MPVVKKVKVIHLVDNCAAEDAEEILQWLIEQPKGKVNLKKCSHLHTAVLQVLCAAKVIVSTPPSDLGLQEALLSAGLTM